MENIRSNEVRAGLAFSGWELCEQLTFIRVKPAITYSVRGEVHTRDI